MSEQKIFTGMTRMPFGTHHDTALEDVPADYLLFLWEDGLWDIESLKARAARPYGSNTQQAHAQNCVALHRYIKDNFSLIEHDNKDVIIKHRPL